MKKHFLILAAVSMTLFAACGKSPSDSRKGAVTKAAVSADRTPFVEAVPVKPDYTVADIVYTGDELYSEAFDSWTISLHTGMEIDDLGYWVGPGQVVRILVNSKHNPEQKLDTDFLCGKYRESTGDLDFGAGTFLDGKMIRIDIPGYGVIEMPDGSFFGDIASGETDFEADLLREGNFSIRQNEDGTFSIEGILVGTDFTKRYFSYRGKPNFSDKAPVKYPNTTITEDLDVSGQFTQAAIYDRGNYFYLEGDGATSYKYYTLNLGQEDNDLSGAFVLGTGKSMQIDFLVPYSTKPEDGLPAGEYNVIPCGRGGMLNRKDIVPGTIVGGMEDDFSRPFGTWYRVMKDGIISNEYARITGGSMTITHEGDTQTVTFDFTDCNEETPHRVYGTWSTTEKIPYI